MNFFLPKKIKLSMLSRFIIMFIAFLAMVFGLSYVFIYINLFSFGYNIKEYLEFLFTRYEWYLFLIGFLVEIICLIRKDKKR